MKILAIQNRMGIGDMVIFLPYIEAISKKFNVPVSILVKESSKANEFLDKNKYIDKIVILDRDNKTGSHDGFIGSIRLINKLKKYNYDKVFIFNSSLRFNLICKLAKIKKIYQYPLFKKKNQHLIETAKKFINKELALVVESNPLIEIDNSSVLQAKKKYTINDQQVNVLLGIGGSGPTKRIPAKKFIVFMKKALEKFDCRFFLATGKQSEEQDILNEIFQSELKNKCLALDDKTINEILPIIKNCKVSICNDSSFSHLSAALDIPTIVLMSDTPLLYGSYSPKMLPIIPKGEKNVGHNTLGKDKIDPEEIYINFLKFVN